MADPSAARLIIDLDALAHNFAVLRAHAGGAAVAPVVKADGYGLGAGPIARRLWREGVRALFVARLAEGEALRAALGKDRPATIFVLDGLTAGSEPRLEAAGLTPVLAALRQVSAARAYAAATGRPMAVALHVDTGMNRQGLTVDEARDLAQAAEDLRGVSVVLLMSHLGSAADPTDPRNAEQLARFAPVRALYADSPASLSASAGIFLGEGYRHEVVRPGVSLYGGGPLERPDARLRAVATLTAPILDTRDLRAGDRVGYGSTMIADRPMRVAVVGAGYADGVIRASRGRGYAWFAGQRRALLSVTMDMLVIELGDVEAQPGDDVELLGPNVHLDDLAAAAGTVAHEVLFRLSPRAVRTYKGES